jgi:hypothetical protein
MFFAFLIGVAIAGVVAWIVLVEPAHRHIENLEISIVKASELLDKAEKNVDPFPRALIEKARVELLEAMSDTDRGLNAGTREDP